jgi:hypothetical protein
MVSKRSSSNAKELIGNSFGPSREDPPSFGPFRRTWERLRDVCYIIQDSKFFQHFTMAMIIANAIVLAIVW